MAINIFEGARRLALLAGGVATLITIIVWFTSTSHLNIYYEITHPNLSAHRTDVDLCTYEGITQRFIQTTKKGDRVWVNLCVMPMSFKDGAKLIPYKQEANGVVWGASRYSNEIEEYRKKLENTFKIPEDQQDEISSLAAKERRKEFTDTFGALFIGLAVFAALVSVIGWIVRGFMGIHNGMDHRP